MQRKKLKLEIDYVFDISEKDSIYIEAEYSSRTKPPYQFHYQMGLSGTKGATAGEMLFHDAKQLGDMSKYAAEAVEDFETTVASIKALKNIQP